MRETSSFELLNPAQYARFLIGNPREIAQILQRMADKRVLITAYADEASLTTSVLSVDEEGGFVVLDAPADEPALRKLFAAPELLCTAQPERIKVQFTCRDLEPWRFEGHPAVRGRLPPELLRLQRREYFRLVAPAAHLLTCQMPMLDASGRQRSYEGRVLDISGGGLAVLVPPDGMELHPGMEFDNCQLALPDVGPLRFRLKVRNIFRVTNRNGITMLRAGCEFLGLPSAASSAIQRYILKAERERSARERER